MFIPKPSRCTGMKGRCRHHAPSLHFCIGDCPAKAKPSRNLKSHHAVPLAISGQMLCHPAAVWPFLVTTCGLGVHCLCIA